MPSAPKWLFDAVDLLLSKLPLIEVDAVQSLSPSLKKLRFKGDFAKLNFPVGCYIDFRVSDTDVRRYSPCFVDMEKEVIEFIVHLHGDGPGAGFMDNLKVGDKIDLNKPRSERKYYDKSARSFVIFGDETSLGLACSFLPVLRKNNHQFLFYFELDDENKDAPAMLGLENCTVFPKNGAFRNDAWLNNLPVFRTTEFKDANYVLTGNVRSAQAFKKAIKNNTNGKTNIHGYWLEGKKGL